MAELVAQVFYQVDDGLQGQEEAAKRIEELTEIPKYRESPSDKK